MSARGLARSAALVGAAVALCVTAAPTASAHNFVVGTDPEDGATATSPVDEVSVTFNDVLLDMGGESTVVDVTGPDGSHYATDCPVISGPEVSVPVELGAAGEYTVSWRVVSADGHPISGDFTFDHEPADEASPDAGVAEPVCGGVSGSAGDDAEGSGDSGAATDVPDQASSDAVSAPVLAGIVVGVALLAGAGVLVALRLGRRRGPGGGAD
ncbi:copper resistance CopC family protein [Isoptericola aurantiacus]|uniref:copper resistance CopC family protein n=1 Tax=Isoptericola aurantiacus TaxID=3377839 RepID=UPI00383ACB52